MRVFIVSDMEGVAGITKWAQVSAGEPLYQEGRKLYTDEINATVAGAASAGANEIVVMDCHGAGGDSNFNSLIPERLDERCEWVVQNEWTEYTAVLEQGCDAALFIGMHAMAGSPTGVLSHTVSGTHWYNLRFNGSPVGETGINAALCGHWGTPVLLVSGDTAVCKEARDLLGIGVTTVPVKQGLGRFSARHLPPRRARGLIEERTRNALGDLLAVHAYDPGRPCEISVDLSGPDRTEEYRYREGCEIVGGRTVVARGDDWLTAWRRLYL